MVPLIDIADNLIHVLNLYIGFLEMHASKSVGKRHEELFHRSSSSNEGKEVSLKHRMVKQALLTFRNLFCTLMQQYKADQPGNLVPSKVGMEAAMLMKRKHQWENSKKHVGHVLGIEVGDRFQYRAELYVIGLHHQFSKGIDYVGTGSESLATSIVVTDRYDNVRKSGTTLIYIGHGGNPNVQRNVAVHDQKMEAGNLALKNSMDAKSPVRVILKDAGKFDIMDNCPFVYDGLYLVDKMVQERGKYEKLVFKFTLNRILGQSQSCVFLKDDVMDNGNNLRQFASFALRKRLKSRSCVVQKDVVRINDISEGKEKISIRVVTPVECDQIITPFRYAVANNYLERFKLPVLCGCDCADGCVDPGKCACIVKNGGKLPYECNKRLASIMESSLIYECDPSCKCPSSCINRVSQHGVQFRLEIFITKLKGWGVRTRSFIPSGSFVCEYIGEVHNKRETRSNLGANDYIFHMGVGKGFIDAKSLGNIGRFINHSCSPNIHVKDVMYDHNDKNLPHKMLFAVKDIPPGRELSYDYNSSKRKFIEFRSNSCYCGSQECHGQF
ncbi:hypothetical protein VNO78_21568 [Psophocarpus tetragonolobus]|uniref:Uncharacterized protein n=1 Tax=Psophocarpus tetragonolobus TaxID=3891 RepID=A0AAN9XI86_PSOTE